MFKTHKLQHVSLEEKKYLQFYRARPLHMLERQGRISCHLTLVSSTGYLNIGHHKAKILAWLALQGSFLNETQCNIQVKKQTREYIVEVC